MPSQKNPLLRLESGDQFRSLGAKGHCCSSCSSRACAEQQKRQWQFELGCVERKNWCHIACYLPVAHLNMTVIEHALQPSMWLNCIEH